MSISGISPSIIKVPSVAFWIVSTDTPGARSNNLNPFGVISNTAKLVTTFLTQATPVKGKEQC